MRNFKFITTLRFLEVREKIEGHFSLMPGIDLINDKKKIHEILDEEFRGVMGQIEFNHFIHSNHILFCEADESIFPKLQSSNQALVVWLGWLNMLINDSWLVKDNAMVCEVAYAQMVKKNHTEWSNNYLGYSNSLSSGQQYANAVFTQEELSQWESQSYRLQKYLHSNDSGAFSSFINKKYSRIGRALKFIFAACKEPHSAIKISHYCSAFESLFSTDSAELSHKLSERVALFLKSFDFDPIAVFDDMKSFYSVRSKVTHGDVIQPSKEIEIPKLSEKCDNYLRSIINFILNEKMLRELFDGNKNVFDNHFKKLLLVG